MSFPSYMLGMTYSLPKPIAEEQRNEINTWDREKIIYWLQWNDSNGIYSDVDSFAEDYPILTIDSARALILEVLAQK